MTWRLPCGRNENTINPLTIELHTRIAAVSENDWDRIVTGRTVFLSRRYLTAVESSRISVCHVVFRLENQAVGVASFQVAAFNGAPLDTYLNLECAVLALVTRPIKIIRAPFASTVVVCGSPLVSGEHGYVFLKCVTPSAAGAALSTAAKMAKAELDLRIPSSAILFKEFYPSSKPLVQMLAKNRFAELQTDPAMVLPIDTEWQTFEGYLNSLSSKYRVKANRAFTKSRDLDERDLLLEDLILHESRLAFLYGAVVERARFKLGGLSAHTLFSLRTRMGEELILKGYFLEQRLVGFRMAFVNGDTLETSLVGFDYSLNSQYAIYPRMLYDYLKCAIDKRLTRVNYGRTASEIKSTLGAVPVQMSCCVTLEKRALNTVLPLLSGAVRPQGFALRKPFKKNWYELNEATWMLGIFEPPAAQPRDVAHADNLEKWFLERQSV